MGWLTLARQARNHGHRPTRRRDMRRAGAGKWRDAGRRAQAGRAVARPRRRQSREEASRPLTSTITDPPHFPSRLEDPPPGPSTIHLIKPPPSPQPAMDSATTRSQSRSRSRGREQLVSTGRGGVGNMRAPSANGGSVSPSLYRRPLSPVTDEHLVSGVHYWTRGWRSPASLRSSLASPCSRGVGQGAVSSGASPT